MTPARATVLDPESSAQTVKKASTPLRYTYDDQSFHEFIYSIVLKGE